jgi:hypothetical protein
MMHRRACECAILHAEVCKAVPIDREIGGRKNSDFDPVSTQESNIKLPRAQDHNIAPSFSTTEKGTKVYYTKYNTMISAKFSRNLTSITLNFREQASIPQKIGSLAVDSKVTKRMVVLIAGLLGCSPRWSGIATRHQTKRETSDHRRQCGGRARGRAGGRRRRKCAPGRG